MGLVDGVGDGVEQMGLAQAGGPVDEQGVIAHSRVLRRLPGGGVGEFVGRAHYKPVEGVLLRAGEKIALLWPVLEAGELILCEDRELKVGGEQLAEGVLDGGGVAGGDNVPFEPGGAVQHKAALLQRDGLGVVKPGVHGGGGHL